MRNIIIHFMDGTSLLVTKDAFPTMTINKNIACICDIDALKRTKVHKEMKSEHPKDYAPYRWIFIKFTSGKFYKFMSNDASINKDTDCCIYLPDTRYLYYERADYPILRYNDDIVSYIDELDGLQTEVKFSDWDTNPVAKHDDTDLII